MNNRVRSWLIAMISQMVVLTSTQLAQDARLQPLIEVGENILVGKDAEHPLAEPQVTANARNPNHLLATATVATNPPFSAKQDCAAFVSFDGGRTWSRHDFGLKGCGDPWVGLRADGMAMFAGLYGRGQIALFQSTDGGRTWPAQPVVSFKDGGYDHQMMTVDTTAGPFAGSFYLVAKQGDEAKTGHTYSLIWVWRSADGGRSFPQAASVTPSNLNLGPDTPAVLSDGTLVIPFTDFQRVVNKNFVQVGLLDRRRSWVLISNDGGKSFSAPKFISEDCGFGGGFNSLAVDHSSGRLRDHIYFLCTTREKTGVIVHHSSDRGEEWSAPVSVDKPAEDVVFRNTPSIAVNKYGVVGISWYERRKDDGKCQHIYFTASLDGGQSFLPTERISSDLSCPDSERNGRAAQRWPAGGDYSGLTATSDGLFHIVWSDSRSRIYEVWTAAVKVNANP